MRKVLLFIIFSFILLSCRGFAFTRFNYNWEMPSDILGYRIIDQGINETGTYKCLNSFWNSTYAGESGVMILRNDNCLGFSTDLVFTIQPLTTSLFVHTSNLLVYASYNPYTTFTIPKNTEVIIGLKYRLNDSANIWPGYPLLFYSIDGVLKEITLNHTSNVWHSKVIIIDADLYRDRNMTLPAIMWNYGSIPDYATFAISRFSIYTYDINEVRNLWTSNATYERIRYCGEGSSDGDIHLDDWFAVLRGGETAYLLANGEDGLGCDAFKLGNLTIARRVLSRELDLIQCGMGYNLHVHRDIYFYNIIYSSASGDCGYSSAWVTESHTLTTAKVTVIRNDYIPASYEIYDGTPTAYVYWNRTLPYILNATRQVVSLNTTPLPSGYNWKLCYSVSCSDWHPFFSSTILCTPKTVCDAKTNYQYVQTEDCSLINPLYCGEWYCNQEGTACNFGLIGSFCLTNTTIKNVSLSGTVNYTYCPIGQYCFQLTPIQATCLTFEEYESMSWYVEPINKTAEIISQYTGWNRAMFLFLVSILCSLGVSGFVTYQISKRGGSGLGIIFGISFIGMLFAFTYVGWVDIVFFIVLLILTGIIVAYSITKMIGG